MLVRLALYKGNRKKKKKRPLSLASVITHTRTHLEYRRHVFLVVHVVGNRWQIKSLKHTVPAMIIIHRRFFFTSSYDWHFERPFKTDSLNTHAICVFVCLFFDDLFVDNVPRSWWVNWVGKINWLARVTGRSGRQREIKINQPVDDHE